MFISLSKTIARFGGFRLGIGMRLNKKNVIWLSLIVMFVAMFRLIWYMLLLCGWMVYAVCYGIYWCIKKIIGASSKKTKQQTPNTMSKSTQKPQTERKEDTPIMTSEINNSPNGNRKNQSPKKKSAIVRWIVGGFFAMFALVNGFHFSSLFLLCAAFLMFPLPFMETFLQKKNIKAIAAIILSVALFFVGVFTSPLSESTVPSDDTTQTTPSDNEDNNNSTKPDNSTPKPDSLTTTPDNSTTNNNTTTPSDNTTTNNDETTKPDDSTTNNDETTKPDDSTTNNDETTKPDDSTTNNDEMTKPDDSTTNNDETTKPDDSTTNNNETTKPDDTTTDEEKVEMVWIPSSGTKYHSKSTCSGMNSPRQIPIEDAKNQGYTACKKCH